MKTMKWPAIAAIIALGVGIGGRMTRLGQERNGARRRDGDVARDQALEIDAVQALHRVKQHAIVVAEVEHLYRVRGAKVGRRARFALFFFK